MSRLQGACGNNQEDQDCFFDKISRLQDPLN
jgi:hypothetical protein